MSNSSLASNYQRHVPPSQLKTGSTNNDDNNNSISASKFANEVCSSSFCSASRVLNSMANSFKLERLESVNSDEDSDDYTKYNRVKFSPTNTVTNGESQLSSKAPAASAASAAAFSVGTESHVSSAPLSCKSTSFSFKNKSSELLKKIQKRNTFAFPKASAADMEEKTTNNITATNTTTTPANATVISETKLFKSKSEHAKKVNSVTLKSLNVCDDSGQRASRNPNINFIKVSPRHQSIAAFSTRNLFRALDSEKSGSPNELV